MNLRPVLFEIVKFVSFFHLGEEANGLLFLA